MGITRMGIAGISGMTGSNPYLVSQKNIIAKELFKQRPSVTSSIVILKNAKIIPNTEIENLTI